MLVVTTVQELRAELTARRLRGQRIALVPTMGALHRGHASLVERCRAENDVVVVTLFVNPTQFNDPADLKRYPRTMEADLALLAGLGTDEVFAPEALTLYPDTPENREVAGGRADRGAVQLAGGDGCL